MKNTLKNINYKYKNFRIVYNLKFTINVLIKNSFFLILLAATNNSFGQTWTSQTSGTANDLYGAFFIDGNNSTAVGTSGKILKTFILLVNFCLKYFGIFFNSSYKLK